MQPIPENRGTFHRFDAFEGEKMPSKGVFDFITGAYDKEINRRQRVNFCRILAFAPDEMKKEYGFYRKCNQ